MPIRRATDASQQNPKGDQPDDDCAPQPLIGEPGDRAIGRSRGGLTTKVHVLSDGAGRLLVVLLTAGNAHDTTMFAPLRAALRVARTGPGRPRTRPDYLVADKGYSSRANRRLLCARGIGHTIPEKADQADHRRRRGSASGRPRLRPRPLRPLQRRQTRLYQLKHWRGLATRYDKHARNYAGAITLAALLTWLP